jgi:hypothetical protein
VLSHEAHHARLANRNSRFVDAAARSKTGVTLIDLAHEVTGILSEGRGIGPRGNEMTTGYVISTVEGTREAVFVQHVSLTARNGNDAEGLKAAEIARPGTHRLVTSPRQLLASVPVVPRPQSSVPFVEPVDSLNTFEGAPRRPPRARR